MAFVTKQRTWDAVSELQPLRGKIRIRSEDREEFEKEIWNDLCSEFDSLRFYQHARACELELSDEFRSFLEAWRADERNHAEGFLWLYHESFGRPVEEIHRRLESRTSDFSRLQWFFEDEFRLCLLIAYDELATTISYHLDRSFYREIGGGRLEAWISRVKADEALHLANLMALIRSRHSHRIPEAREILDRILDLDLNQTQYDGTFVLDHTGSPFGPEMLRDCADRIIRKLGAAA
jgi:hypothetical protein